MVAGSIKGRISKNFKNQKVVEKVERKVISLANYIRMILTMGGKKRKTSEAIGNFFEHRNNTNKATF